MRRIAGSVFCALWIVFFAIVVAQVPALIVQYAQRLGGATDEAAAFLQKFDEGASRAGYTRKAAIENLLKNQQPLVQEQGIVFQSQAARFERLSRQRDALGNGLTLGGIYYFMTDYDASLLKKTLGDFSLAIPLSVPGFIFALLGCLFGAALLFVGASLVRTTNDRAIEA